MLDAVTKTTHYRRRADEMRKIAEGIFDRRERALLLEIAMEYEHIARSHSDANGGNLS